MQALGVPVEVTETVLNHISGTRADIAGVYNRYRYDPEKRKALDTWAIHLQNLVEGREGTNNVLPFVRYACSASRRPAPAPHPRDRRPS